MDILRGVGVLVLQDDKVLVATRTDDGSVCGPGGHLEAGEDLYTAAMRETEEEFGIVPTELELLGELSGMPDRYCNSTVYLCTQYTGEPTADNIEMKEANFVEIAALLEYDKVFLPFKESLKLLQQKDLTISTTFKVTKSNKEEGLVSGWANVAVNADGTLPLDWQDDVISPVTLEKAAVNFMMEYRGSGVMHEGDSKGVVVESIVFTKEKQAAIGIPDGIVPEGWFITVKVLDNDIFEQVKNGTYKMFSIQGHAKRVEF